MRSLARRLSVRGWLLAPATVLLAIVIPALAYTLLGSALPGALPALQYAVASAYALTATMTLLEARAALGTHDEPPTADVDDPLQLAELPSLTAIVSAYLPNEQELVAETIVHLATELRVAPGSLQIILAYNTPEDMPDVEGVLASLAELNVAFVPLRVPTSRSKSENVNAAMGAIRGEVTVLLDADHRPARDAAVRALRWFASGYDIVQGRCVIRDSDTNWLSRVVAVEFEQIYAVSHAGRSLAFDTAVFCGTNGWWRTSVLRQIGMDDQMLTEDIDSSVRALLAGHRTIHDRTIISTELAPPTPKAWWGQRMRWAQGWFQVTLKHQGAIVRSPRLRGELKLYWTYLLGWRELFPVLSLQIFALLLTNLLLGRRFAWFYDPYLVITTTLTLTAGPIAALMSYRVALESQRRELRWWFLIYAATALLYTTAKNTVAMVATVRELLGERGWIVTTRAAAPRGAPAATTAALALLCAGIAGASTAPAAQAHAAESATVRLKPLASAMTLSGRAPLATISVPVPNDWRTAGGTLVLGWQASPSVTPNSTLTVRVDGVPLAAQAVQAGRGRMDVRIAQHAVPGHRLQIQIAGQLHSRVDVACCIPDAATGAIVALHPTATRLRLTGRRATAAPLLAELPGSLVDVIGNHATPLYISLPSRPSAFDIRAATVVASGVARASGVRSVPIRVVRGGVERRLLKLGGNVVRVRPFGAARASVRRRPDGRLIVTVAGRGDGAVRAAWALARSRPRFYPGSSAAISSGLDTPDGPPVSRVAKITPSGAQGTGPLLFTAGFRLPESRELTTGKARLELDAGFTAPGGGRIDVALNGLALLSHDLPEQGAGQARLAIDLVQDPVDAIDHRVALGNLAVGDNFLAIRANLPPGQPVGGSGDALVPELSILPTSRVRYESKPRDDAEPGLDLWPWPYTAPGAMTGTTLVLPAAPTARELAAAIATIAESARWTGAAAAPRVAIAPAALPDGNVVALARGLSAPVALPGGAPLPPHAGLLQTWASDGRRLLVAYGVAALRPLESDYHTGKVTGIAAVVGKGARVTTLESVPAAAAFEDKPLPWKIPAAILVLATLLLLGIRIRKVRRRLEELPAPVPTAPLDDAAVRAQLEDWERLVRQESSAGTPRDDAPTRP